MIQEREKIPHSPESSLTILVVEDHESYREVVCRGLESYVNGVKTLGAGSVAHAADLLEREAVDMMIVDMTLPDGTALDLLREGRASIALGMKVILFSNYSAAEMQPLRDRPDVHAVLTKEQGLRALAKTVRELSPNLAGTVTAVLAA